VFAPEKTRTGKSRNGKFAAVSLLSLSLMGTEIGKQPNDGDDIQMNEITL
jgi:hypothetical protein